MDSELIEKLREVEETILMELLEVNSHDLVDAFLDRIKDNEDKLYRYIYVEE